MPKSQQITEYAEKALDAANEAARLVSNVHISFLLFCTYIGIIIASTTDVQLLRIDPINLPILNVNLPISGFFIFVPWLVVLLHLNFLLHLVWMANKVRLFLDAAKNISDEKESDALRGQLFDFPVIHMLTGQRHDAFMEWIIVGMVYIPMIAVLGGLLWAQKTFLRYDEIWITWVQCSAVIVDAVLLMALWPRVIFQKGGALWWWSWRQWRLLLGFQSCWANADYLKKIGVMIFNIAILIIVILSLMAATYFKPESLDISEQVLTANAITPEMIAALRFGTNEEKKKALKNVQGLNLRGRNLNNANFYKSVIPKADLGPLRNEFGFLSVITQIKGADFGEAQLQAVNFSWAQLQGANFLMAQMQGANLSNAQLQGGNFQHAQMQGVNLSGAQLQGATFGGAELQGADLSGAQLQGANFSNAQLQGVNLKGAQMHGANLWQAALQGANFESTQLQGANLNSAFIGGATFSNSSLRFAILTALHEEPLTEVDYQALLEALKTKIPDETLENRILSRIRPAVGKQTAWYETDTSFCFSDKAVPSRNCVTNDKGQLAYYLKNRAEYLVDDLACHDPTIARGMLVNAVIDNDFTLGKALLEAKCKAVKTAREGRDWPKSQLEQLVNQSTSAN